MHGQTWVYKTVYLKSGLSSGDKQAEKFNDQLSDLGIRGWELVTVFGSNIAFFKKPR